MVSFARVLHGRGAPDRGRASLIPIRSRIIKRVCYVVRRLITGATREGVGRNIALPNLWYQSRSSSCASIRAYNRKAPWSIPKGEPDGDSGLEETARRETLEETGVRAGSLVPLGHIDYRKSRKRVYCFAGPAPADATPSCSSWEIDQARFVPIEEGRELLHPDQQSFIDRLIGLLDTRSQPPEK